MHKIAYGIKCVGGTRHIPHLLSKLVGVGFLNVPLTTNPTIVYLQPFSSKSFRKKWLNNFTEVDKDY